MAKNDFDIDFDFEKEYGFDPKAILDSDFSDEDLDLSQFEEEQLSIDLSAENEDDFDFTSLNLDARTDRDIDLDDLDLDDVLEEEAAEKEDLLPEEEEDEFGFGEDLDAEDDFAADFEEEEPFEEDDFQEEFSEEAFAEEDYDEDLTSDMDFSRRASFFEGSEEQPQEEAGMDMYAEEISEELPAEEAEDPAEEPQEDPKPVRRRREPVQKERKPIKLTVPPGLKKVVKLYFPTAQEINPPMDPNDPNPKRRRKKSKMQIFKEFYLPTIIAGLALVLMLSFVIGSLGNAIDRHQIKKEEAEKESLYQESEAERVQTEAASLLTEAERLASGYNYQGAIDLLNSFTGDQTQFADLYQQISTKKAEYTNAKSQLVEHKDPSTIPNLSFHVLMADPVRAFADKEFGGLYNRNFVSTDEFEKILDQLYVNGFVLVDYDSFISSNEGVDSTQSFFHRMYGNTDNHIVSNSLTNLCGFHVILSNMNAISMALDGNFHIVINEERNSVLLTQSRDFDSFFQKNFVIQFLFTKLNTRCASFQSRLNLFIQTLFAYPRSVSYSVEQHCFFIALHISHLSPAFLGSYCKLHQ